MIEFTSSKLRRGDERKLKKWLFQKILLIMLFFGAIPLNAQIHIGASGTGTSSYFPIYGTYDFSYTQQIVLASEYAAADGVAGPITQIKWKIVTNGNGDIRWNDWTIYIGHTTKTSFANTTDYVPFSSLTQVYSGIMTFEGNNTWVTVNIPATSPFVYNGTDNIVVAVIENADGWGGAPTFQSYTSTTTRGLYGYQDNTEINVANPGSTQYKYTATNLAQIQFTGTMSPCAVPQNILVNATNTSAVATWDNNTFANLGYAYELRTTGAAGSGATGLVYSGDLAAGVNTITFNGLVPGTSYNLYLKSKCTGYNGSWSPARNFSTFLVQPSPWFEGFATTTIPLGWSQLTTSAYSFGAAPTNFNINPPAVGNVAYKNIYGTSYDLSGLAAVTVGPILPGDKLSFDYKSGMYYTEFNVGSEQGAVSPDMGSVDLFISTNFGSTWTSIGTIEFGEIGWQHFETVLSDYASVGQFVKFKFVTHWNEVLGDDGYNDSDFNFAIDNFYIGSCSMPPSPIVSNTTMNTALLEWEALPTDVFEIEYGVTGFTQGAGTIVIATGASHLITGLTQSTEYEFFLRRKCSDTNFSPRTGKFKFTTSCPVFEGTFTETFDSTTTGTIAAPTVPTCWHFIKGGPGYGYVNTGSAAPASPTKHFYIYTNTDSNTQNPYILVSPETNNLGNGGYQVRFKARVGTSGTKLKVGIMSNKLDASTFVEVQEIALPTTYSATDYVVYLPATTSDYFAFKFAQTGSYQSLYIDDVVYEPIPACAPPIYLNATKNFADLSANLTWQGPSNVTNNNFEIQWGVAGFALGTGTITTSTTLNKEITDLTLGTTYSFYVRRMCGAESTAWVGPYTFEMDYCESDFNTFDGDGITAIAITGQQLPILLDETYQFIENAGIAFNSVDEQNIAITFETGFDTSFKVYIDLNNNGFEANDLYVQGYNADGEGTTTSIFTLPNNGEFLTGNYRVRIITEYGNSISGPCETGSWGQTYDFYADFTFPCIQPTDINFLDVGYEYVVLDWQGQGSSNFEIEYGLTGFTQGTGTVVANVTKPYTLEGLTPGATYDFYIRKQCGPIYSDWSAVATTYVFCDTPEPVGAPEQTLIADETLANLAISGQNIKFYTDPGLTNEVPASTALQVSGTYFVTQTINCESDGYLQVNVTVIPRTVIPTVGTVQNFCGSAIISDIQVTSLPTATVTWYATATSTVALPVNTPLATGTYYVSQAIDDNASHRVAVTVTVNPVPANLVPQPVHLCGAYTFANVSINSTPGATVRWYASLTATTPFGDNVQITSGTYYVTQSFGVCESDRVPYVVSQYATLNKPIAATQNICGSGTVADLTAEGLTGAQILWYASLTSATPLASTTPLYTGTYYVAQTMNGCYSERRAVAVRVISVLAPQINPFTICGGGTISSLYLPTSGDISYKWFISPSSEFELAQTTPLVQGTYYVERVQGGCVSARAAVQVNIGTVPSPPTGVPTQSFVQGSTIANLILDQTNVVWYSSFYNSQNGINPLSQNMPLVNGNTYYAVIIGTNGCPSYPFAVTVNIYLSNDEFDKEGLKYFPNPVEDILNINYSEIITQIEVYDLLGKRVKSVNTNGNNVELNLSDLASGTYMIQLKSETKQQFIKIVKK